MKLLRRTLVAAAFLSFIIPASASAQLTGLVFALPEGTPIVLPSGGDPGDKVLFVGGPSEIITGVSTCGGNTTPFVQNAIFVDTRQPGRTALRSEVVILSPSEPVSPGTRLTNLVSAGPNCTINGVGYSKYTGTVD